VSCLFCELAAGRGERSVAYEDELAVAIMDLNPVNDGHVLVLPKTHADGLADLDEDLGAHLFRVASRLAAALRRTEIRCEGINLFLADGEAAGQDVFHAHLHVLPRYDGDPFRLSRDGGFQQAGRPELDRAAAEIREALAA
jgi:diadenosine tetraphosphate (Ap4A) HIT family hydrolase